jgi:hypothetical protein
LNPKSSAAVATDPQAMMAAIDRTNATQSLFGTADERRGKVFFEAATIVIEFDDFDSSAASMRSVA